MSTKTIKLTDEQGNLLLPECIYASDGVYKFADGTMMQIKQTTLTCSTTQVGTSGVYCSPTLNLTFDEPFADNKYIVIGNSRYSTGFPFPLGTWEQTSNFFLAIVYDFTLRTNVGYNIRYMAIGRWK